MNKKIITWIAAATLGATAIATPLVMTSCSETPDPLTPQFRVSIEGFTDAADIDIGEGISMNSFVKDIRTSTYPSDLVIRIHIEVINKDNPEDFPEIWFSLQDYVGIVGSTMVSQMMAMPNWDSENGLLVEDGVVEFTIPQATLNGIDNVRDGGFFSGVVMQIYSSNENEDPEVEDINIDYQYGIAFFDTGFPMVRHNGIKLSMDPASGFINAYWDYGIHAFGKQVDTTDVSADIPVVFNIDVDAGIAYDEIQFSIRDYGGILGQYMLNQLISMASGNEYLDAISGQITFNLADVWFDVLDSTNFNQVGMLGYIVFQIFLFEDGVEVPGKNMEYAFTLADPSRANRI